MAWYVIHRLQQVSEIDQDKVKLAIESFIKRGKFPHALLFAGPKGTGKTSTARLVAKILNCQNPPSGGLGEPCNNCSNCLEINRGSSMTVVELDGASNRGIEDIRSLRETVKLSPPTGRTKVYIIDEAHMLTTEAFNALLKTLEEPPEHVVFILATTELYRLPQTIRSRATLINFSQASKEEIMQSLKRIIKNEKLEIENGVLDLIVNFAEGSFRDAIKIMEQLATEKKITLEQTKNFFKENLANPDVLINFLIKKDIKGALEEIDLLSQKGTNLKQFTIQLIETLRLILLAKFGVGEKQDDLDINTEQLKRLIDLLLVAVDKMRISPIAELPLELAVVEWGREDLKVSQAIRSSHNSVPTDGGTGPRVSAPPKHRLQPLGPTSNKWDLHSSPVSTSSRSGGGGELRSSIDSASLNKEEGGKEIKNRKKIEINGELWNKFILGIKSQNHSIAALLLSCRPLNFDGQTLEISVFYQFHKEKLEQPTSIQIIEEGLAKTLGEDLVRVVFELGEKPASEQSSAGRQKGKDISSEVLTKEEDIVKAAEEIFGTTELRN